MFDTQTFPGQRYGKAFFPVVHVADQYQAVRDLEVAAWSDADGAFLISHGPMQAEELAELYALCKGVVPGAFLLGANFYPKPLLQAFGYAPKCGLDALWADDGMPRYDPPRPATVNDIRAESSFRGLLFGGLAFKGQRQVDDSLIPQVVELAKACMDVIVTSGPETGTAPALRKMALLRECCGDFPLGIASGMTPENIRDFLPYADCFLVNTGISSDGGLTLDKRLTPRMAELIHT